MNWKQAEPAPEPEPGAINPHQLLLNLRDRRDRDNQIAYRLESNVIQGLEKELSEIEAKTPAPPARFSGDESSATLTTSVMIEILTPTGPSGECVPAGCVISTLEGSALEALRARIAPRKVVRVSLETLRDRKAAGHVAE